MKKLTHRQQAVLDYIESYYADQGFSPSFDEICAHFGFKSYNSVTDYIKVLKKKGFLEYTPGKSRNIIPKRIVRQHQCADLSIPLVGAIAAGMPVEAAENIEDHLDGAALGLSPGSGALFALRVRGNSMIGRGIHNGDIVIVRQQKEVAIRDVAAVRIGNEATLKYVRRDRTHLRLVPDNPDIKTMVVGPEDDVEIMGKVVRLIRTEI